MDPRTFAARLRARGYTVRTSIDGLKVEHYHPAGQSWSVRLREDLLTLAPSCTPEISEAPFTVYSDRTTALVPVTGHPGAWHVGGARPPQGPHGLASKRVA